MKTRIGLAGTAAIFVFTVACSEDPKESGPSNSGSDDAGSQVATDSGSGAGAIDAGSACETWVVEYDLAGSKFDIRNTPFGAGDASNDIGPGTMKLRFNDDDGSLALGPVSLISYDMTMVFDVNMVLSELMGSSGPDECGVSAGDFAGDAISWSGPMRGYNVVGTITCNASEVLCAAASLPHKMAKPIDDTSDQALNLFAITATAGQSSFTMDFVEIPNENAGDTFLRLVGTETARNCVPAPSCN